MFAVSFIMVLYSFVLRKGFRQKKENALFLEEKLIIK